MSGTNKLSAPILSSSRPETTAPGSREILLALICLSRCRSQVSSNPSGLGGAKVLDSVDIGGVTLEKVPVMVMDHPTVTAISNAIGPIDGLIGFPFFVIDPGIW